MMMILGETWNQKIKSLNDILLEYDNTNKVFYESMQNNLLENAYHRAKKEVHNDYNQEEVKAFIEDIVKEVQDILNEAHKFVEFFK